jgi:hypothetical protein
VLDLSGWAGGMRVIVRAERPHPGAQLRFTDVHGNRLTAFATNTIRGQLADLELPHWRRARCEDRIRIGKDTGLRNLPLHGYAQNHIWLAIVTLAVELTAWTGDPRLDRARRPATGTQTTTARAVRHTQPDRPPRTQHLPDQHQPGSSQHHTPEKWNPAAHLSRQLPSNLSKTGDKNRHDNPSNHPRQANHPAKDPG